VQYNLGRIDVSAQGCCRGQSAWTALHPRRYGTVTVIVPTFTTLAPD
jgi:hypothetical protein